MLDIRLLLLLLRASIKLDFFNFLKSPNKRTWKWTQKRILTNFFLLLLFDNFMFKKVKNISKWESDWTVDVDGRSESELRVFLSCSGGSECPNKKPFRGYFSIVESHFFGGFCFPLNDYCYYTRRGKKRTTQEEKTFKAWNTHLINKSETDRSEEEEENQQKMIRVNP